MASGLLAIFAQVGPYLWPVLAVIGIYFYGKSKGKLDAKINEMEAADNQDKKLHQAAKEVQKLEDQRHETIEKLRDTPLADTIRLWNARHGKGAERSPSDTETK